MNIEGMGEGPENDEMGNTEDNSSAHKANLKMIDQDANGKINLVQNSFRQSQSNIKASRNLNSALKAGQTISDDSQLAKLMSD